MTTTFIENELEATGVAQVIVILKPGAASALAAAGAAAVATYTAAGGGAAGAAAAFESVRPGIMAHFRSSERSVNSQIAAAGMKKADIFLGAAAATAATVVQPAPVQYYPNLGVMLGTVDRAGLVALEGDPQVDQVTGAPQISPIWPENIAAAKAPKDLTWGLRRLNVERVWTEGFTGKGVRVGHLDTGIDGKHATLSKAVKKFAEFDLFGKLRKPAPKPYDTEDHGTHSAATIAGRPVGNHHVGVAPDADLLGAIVIEGGNVIARVLGGIDWALGQNMKVLSMSLGFRGWWDNFLPIMAVLRLRDVLPVIAVGNEGPGTSRSPGNYPNVLSVGAMSENGRVANFSGSQSFARPDRPEVPYLVAPGVDVVSAKPGGGYQSMSGSSMATPHVAGLAALLFQARPAATAAQVEQAILGSCTLLRGMTAARAGVGCPDAVRALEILTGASLTPVSAPKKPAAKKKSSAKKKSPAKKRPASRKAAAPVMHAAKKVARRRRSA
ncbi:MAG TPA: S8 family serine peptidase [Thermoanaerobaculia bacterium]